MKKILSTFLACILIMVMFTACGSDQNVESMTIYTVESPNQASKSTYTITTSNQEILPENTDEIATATDLQVIKQEEYLPVNTGMPIDVIKLDSLPKELIEHLPVWYTNGEIVQMSVEFYNQSTKESRWINAFAKEGEDEYGTLELQENEILGRYNITMISQDSVDTINTYLAGAFEYKDGLYLKKAEVGYEAYHMVTAEDIAGWYIFYEGITEDEISEMKEAFQQEGYKSHISYLTGGTPYETN